MDKGTDTVDSESLADLAESMTFFFDLVLFGDDIHMMTMKTVQFSRPPTLVHLHSKFFHSLDLGRPISNEPPPTPPPPKPVLQMITIN